MVFIIDNSDSINTKIDDYLNIRNNIIKSKKKMKVQYSDDIIDNNNNEQFQIFINIRKGNKEIYKGTTIDRIYSKEYEKKKLFRHTNKLGRRENNTTTVWKQKRYNLRSRKK